MGIYDRDYYRREGPSFLGMLAGSGQVCKGLILVNVACFILQILWPQFTEALILDSERVAEGQVWRLLTYSFLHAPFTPWHILFNMLFLWWFGRDMEDLYGPREFLAFYLVAALLGGLAFQVTWAAGKTGPFCLGASGAVTAALTLCALHYPGRIIYIWFVLPVPIWAFVVFLVAQDFFGFVTGADTKTAVTVHLAGAAFAFAYQKSQIRLLSLGLWFRSRVRQRSRPKLRVYHEETPEPVHAATAPPAADVDEQLEAKLDAVLEKVARHGQASLTEGERQVLLRASEVYKRRRT